MVSYIGVTSREWFVNLNDKYIKQDDEINFWKKSTSELKRIKPGDDFYFLVKNPKNIKGERQILGKAKYIRFELNNYEQAWRKYGSLNGCNTIEEFRLHMTRIYDNDSISEFGSIILDNFEVFDQGYKPSEIGIKFANSIVAGKYLDEKEDNIIKGIIGSNKFSNIIYDSPESYLEGKESFVTHIKKERNPLVKQAVIEKFLINNERVYCEACGFDFYDKYGELGRDYIECHHTKPIHQMKRETETKLVDMALLCSNCHRMIHKKNPMLSLDELKGIISKNNK